MQTVKTTSRPNVIWSLLRQVGGESGDWLLLALGFLLGMLAFLWAGYLGNPTDPRRLFREPWSLFGYLCLVMIVLEASILLDPHLPGRWKPSRRRVAATLVVTIAWIVIVSVGYLIGREQIASWLQKVVPAVLDFIRRLGAHKQIVFTVADLACILILWLGIRFASYDPEAAVSSPQAGFRGERLTGDLLLSTLFSVILAWAFFFPFWQGSSALGAPGHLHQGTAKAVLSVCDLTFLPYSSPCTLAPFDLTTIFMLDLLILPLVYLGIALTILVLAAFQQALERGNAEEFTTAFLDAVRDVINRRVTLPNLLLALRYIWPILLLAATILAGVASKAIAQYLYDAATASKGNIFWLDLSWPVLALQFGAMAAVLVAMAAAVSASTLQVVRRAGGGLHMRRELAFTWRHVRFFALMLAVSYWAFSVFFSIVNGLALIGVREYEVVTKKQLPTYHWAPFIQPDPLMLLSLAVFVFFAVRQLRRRASASAVRLP